MNPAGNFENRDLMKRATWLMQGSIAMQYKPHSRMLAQSFPFGRLTKGGLFPLINFKYSK